MPDFLARATLVLWAAPLSGFTLAAKAKSSADGKTSTRISAAVSLSLVALLCGAQIFQNFSKATESPRNILMTEEIAAAGAWLEESNEGGNIIVGPYQNQVPSRAMPAMGGYSALQSCTPYRIVFDRDLPPHGPEPMWDVLRVVYNPGEEQTARILAEYDIRYIVFYKRFDPETVWGDGTPEDWWREFEESPDLYENVFENDGVVIFEPTSRAYADSLAGE